LIRDSHFFTSVCYGKDANLLQEEDHINGGDWSISRRDDCIFGYAVNPTSRLPSRSFRTFEDANQQRRFYLIPPEAFTDDSIKKLSQIQLILIPEQGCTALGSLGMTADGTTYQCNACDFLRAGGVCPATDGARALVMPTSKNLVFDDDTNGGAFGFQGFPLIVFKRDFSLYFTGKDGYAPPSLYFENIVDVLSAGIPPKITSEMSNSEIREIAARFDSAHAGIDPKSRLASVEIDATPNSPLSQPLRAKQEIVFNFSAKPGMLLSSIAIKLVPVDNVRTRQFLEMNPCLLMNGKEQCFTGIEDFVHCAFFHPCTTGFSTLKVIGGISADGYIATRYFPAGTAPILRDGKISIRLLGPDIGSLLQVDANVRVRNPGSR